MNEKELEKLKETAWRRNLSEQEAAATQSGVEMRGDLEEEMALSAMLGQLPDAPISSNFTSQVLQIVEQEKRQTASKNKFLWFNLKWKPHVAFAGLVLVIGFISLTQYRSSKRAQIAQDVATVSSALSLPTQWLEDFDAISRLNQPPVDDELLAALQ